MPVSPPHVRDTLLDGWRLVDDTTATPYDGAVTVTAHTLVYEDAALRDRVRDAAGVDLSVRFFLASRVRVSPLAMPASFLRARVARESAEAFVARLRDAGVRGVRERDVHAETVGGSRAVVAEYGGSYPVGDATLRVAARIAARTAGREFLVTGGAFPTGVGGDGATAALSALLSPSSYRADLAVLMEETRATGPVDHHEE